MIQCQIHVAATHITGPTKLTTFIVDLLTEKAGQPLHHMRTSQPQNYWHLLWGYLVIGMMYSNALAFIHYVYVAANTQAVMVKIVCRLPKSGET